MSSLRCRSSHLVILMRATQVRLRTLIIGLRLFKAARDCTSITKAEIRLIGCNCRIRSPGRSKRRRSRTRRPTLNRAIRLPCFNRSSGSLSPTSCCRRHKKSRRGPPVSPARNRYLTPFRHHKEWQFGRTVRVMII